MPSKRQPGPHDRERILEELRTLAPIPLTRLDITDELGLPYAYTSELLAELEQEGAVLTKHYGPITSAKLFYVPEAA